MKIRNGFVSNSSSSSFICEICGAECSGMDMCLSDAEMYSCENGHTFCDSHAINMGDEKEICIELIKSTIESTKENILKNPNEKYYQEHLIEEEEILRQLEADEDIDFDDIMSEYEFRYELPAKYCPICQMEHIIDSDMVSYLMKKYNVTPETMKAEIKSNFKNYKDLINYIK